MRKWVQIAVAVLVVALVGVFAWLVMREREPVYEGKRLRAWLMDYGLNLTNVVERSTAEAAVRHIGTNGIPTLLKMLREDEPMWLLFFVRHLDWRSPNWLFRLGARGAWQRNYYAALGFEILGADAEQAVPILAEIFEQNISGPSQDATSKALAAIGPGSKKAVPTLLHGATSSNEEVRRNAVFALGHITTEPKVVVPALVQSLSDNQRFVRSAAAEGLGGFGADARPAVPALVKSLSDRNRDVRSVATNALKQIDAEAAAKAGVK